MPSIYENRALDLLSKVTSPPDSQPWEMGIDEAGRGPVLGPMVYGAVAWPESLSPALAKVGFDDSKQINEKHREEMFTSIKLLHGKLLHYFVRVLGPEELSQSMQAIRPLNLNFLSHRSAFELIRQGLNQGLPLRHVYLDTVGPPESYKQKLESEFSDHPELQFTVCPKADSLYKSVSAASICAKVTRDHNLRDWQFVEGTTDRDFGCGYPSHPETVAWLSRNTQPVFGFPRLVRFSWETARRKMRQECAETHFQGERGEKAVRLAERVFQSAWY